MHLKEQWIREGFSSYYVVKKEQKLTYEKNILYNHTLPCLLPCEFRIEDGEEYYYYKRQDFYVRTEIVFCVSFGSF